MRFASKKMRSHLANVRQRLISLATTAAAFDIRVRVTALAVLDLVVAAIVCFIILPLLLSVVLQKKNEQKAATTSQAAPSPVPTPVG
jgi:hypothetical protein